MTALETITGKIAALDRALADLDQEANRLALPAVNGDAGAAKALVDVRKKIAAATADREVLTRAREQAVAGRSCSR